MIIPKRKIPLPNGELRVKKQYNIICTLENQNNNFFKGKISSTILKYSNYYIIQNIKSDEIESIIEKKFEDKEFSDEEKEYLNKFNISINFEKKENINSNHLTLNDIDKYINLREKTYNIIDKQVIELFIFCFRHYEDKLINKLINELELKYPGIPYFEYFDVYEQQILLIYYPKDNKKFLSINVNNRVEPNKIYEKLQSLNKIQRFCLLFIACAYKSKIYSILQGPTASGKTYLIRLFCEMIGRKLIIYQLNKDTPLSILSGQYIYNKNKRENNLKDKNELNDNENEDEFVKMQKKIKEERALNPLNSFKYEESIFIQTLKSGENIILMDGIESAPINIIETLSSLCEDNPNFTISLNNSIITFKKQIDKDSSDNNEKNKIIKINDDFYIFYF